jgi:hypothetical protein
MAKKTVVVNTLKTGLQALATKVPIFAAQALNEEAEETMRVSKLITPVSDEDGKPGGRLRRSGRVQHANAKHLVARLTYGTDYALYVHEIPPPPEKSSPGGRSARHDPPTSWKFLEIPINHRGKTFEARVGAAIYAKIAAASKG